MAGKIYVLQGDAELKALEERPYVTEDLLQELLGRYPDLLAGDQLGGGEPRRWLLVSRETPVPDQEDGAGRWSLDHLFLDQDAVPTLVEVKRSSDTRIRREVVGQMLDYAANAVVYWPVETIRAKFEAACVARKGDPAGLIAELLQAEPGDQEAVEVFWGRVKTNLQAGKIRMVFVADEIPPELRRIIEFLNGQMDPAEVLGVEVRQFVGEGIKTLVPKLIGQTEAAHRAKSSGGVSGKQWDEASFIKEMETRHGPEAARVAKVVLEWSAVAFSRIFLGSGEGYGTFTPILQVGKDKYRFFRVSTDQPVIDINLRYLKDKPPFMQEEKRLEFLRRLNEIPGLNLLPDVIENDLVIPLACLVEATALNRFQQAIEWAMNEVKSLR